jgi:hypothetical protein
VVPVRKSDENQGKETGVKNGGWKLGKPCFLQSGKWIRSKVTCKKFLLGEEARRRRITWRG